MKRAAALSGLLLALVVVRSSRSMTLGPQGTVFVGSQSVPLVATSLESFGCP